MQSRINANLVQTNKQTSIFSSPSLGLEFQYPTGADGYILKEIDSLEAPADLVREIVLTRTEDADKNLPAEGEGPPTLTLLVFKNTSKQWPQIWADQHVQYSNINLKIGEVSETTVGGANAIRYIADGLYASQNIVLAHGDYVYMISGMFIDKNSPLYSDFEPLVKSVRFIQ